MAIPVTRVSAVSQGQNILNEIHNELIDATGLQAASVLLWLGCLGFVTTGAFVAKDWRLLVYRDRLSQRSKGWLGPEPVSEENTMPEGFLLPPKWDEALISVEIRNLHQRPNMLKVFTRGLVDRFVAGQDDKTAKRRIEYLRTKLEEVQVAKELQRELDDLQFRESEFTIRQLQKDIEMGDLEHRRRVQRELHEAEHRRDLLKVKAESASFEKQIRESALPTPKKEEKPSAAEGVSERIQRLKEARAYARETVKDPNELRRVENMYDDKLTELENELRGAL